MDKLKNIIILAGGKSSRFSPLTHKNLIQFNGLPLIEHQLKKYSNFTDNLVVVSSESTKKDIEIIAKRYNAKVILQEGDGQGAAVISSQNSVDGETLIVNGNDMYHDEMIQKVIEKAHDESVDGIFVAIKVKNYVPGGYLELKDGSVTGVVEKPGAGNEPSPYWKLVIDYVKDIQGFISAIKSAQSDKDDFYEVGLSNFIQSGKTFKYIDYKKDWATIKYPWHVLDASSYFLKQVESYVGENVSIDSTAKIVGDVYIDDGVKIYEYSKVVGPCYIGKNTIIGNYALVLQSMIGEKSVIGGYSEITRSYLGDNVWTHRAYVGDSIIEGEANFGAGSITANYRFDKKEVISRVKNEKISTERSKMGLIAGRDVQLGVNSVTMPGLQLSAGARIQPGEVCSRDR